MGPPAPGFRRPRSEGVETLKDPDARLQKARAARDQSRFASTVAKKISERRIRKTKAVQSQADELQKVLGQDGELRKRRTRYVPSATLQQVEDISKELAGAQAAAAARYAATVVALRGDQEKLRAAMGAELPVELNLTTKR